MAIHHTPEGVKSGWYVAIPESGAFHV